MSVDEKSDEDHSTEEATEQREATSSGGRGGKGLTQGKQPTGGRGSDTGPKLPRRSDWSLGAFIHEDVDKTWGTEEEREKRRKMFLSFYSLAKKHNRLTIGSDAAFAVAMLASRESEWMTGQVFSVSGGFCMAG